MSTTRAPLRNATVAAQAPRAALQEQRPAPAKIGPESAFGAAVKNREVLGAGGMLALQAAAGNRAMVGLARGAPAAVQRMPVSQPGVTSTAGEGYIDDRGNTLMYRDQETGSYVIGGQSYWHYPESDQYMNSVTGAYWDPVRNVDLTLQQSEDGSYWYYSPHDTRHYYYDGRLYQPHQPPQPETPDAHGEGEVARGHHSLDPTIESSSQRVSSQGHDVVNDSDLEALDIGQLMSAQELLKQSIASKALAIAFIQSEAQNDAMAAIRILRSWNSAYGQVQELAQPKAQQTPAPGNPTNKRKYGQQKASSKPAVFEPISLAECDLTARGLMVRLESDRRSEETREKAETARKKPKSAKLSTLEYNGRNFKLSLLSEGGGFYDVYDITDTQPIIEGFSNEDLVLRIPKEGPNLGLARAGLRTHGQLAQKQGVSVPEIRNSPARDGFFIVEKIAHELQPRDLLAKSGFAALSPAEQQRLTQIRSVLQSNAASERAEAPDFRPSNLRFRSANSQDVVLVDFTDEARLGENTGDAFWRDMKMILNELCEGRTDHWLYRFLVHNFTSEQKQKLEHASEF